MRQCEKCGTNMRASEMEGWRLIWMLIEAKVSTEIPKQHSRQQVTLYEYK